MKPETKRRTRDIIADAMSALNQLDYGIKEASNDATDLIEELINNEFKNEKINEQKLNEKLLRFAGFICVNEITFDNGKIEKTWQLGDIVYKYDIDLVHDLIAQQTYLYPKLAEARIQIEMRKDFDYLYLTRPYSWTFFKGISILSQGEDKDNLAVAFALAVEKYIDSLNKDKEEK